MGLFKNILHWIKKLINKRADTDKNIKVQAPKIKRKSITEMVRNEIKRRSGLCRASGYHDHKLYKNHFGTFSPVRYFRVNGKEV
ncbi:MAG: hypothetical protein M0P71_16160 [Melioribacteraceae bacterium]|jgi:hypothetical protein|nr:hypothetical protein [Melioribacteraceae bacterium]